MIKILDANDKTALEKEISAKQDALTAGDNITIDGNTISATGATVEQVLTEGTEIAKVNDTSIYAPAGGGSSHKYQHRMWIQGGALWNVAGFFTIYFDIITDSSEQITSASKLFDIFGTIGIEYISATGYYANTAQVYEPIVGIGSINSSRFEIWSFTPGGYSVISKNITADAYFSQILDTVTEI